MQESLDLGARSLLCCCLLACGSLWFLATEDTAQISPVMLIWFSYKVT